MNASDILKLMSEIEKQNSYFLCWVMLRRLLIQKVAEENPGRLCGCGDDCIPMIGENICANCGMLLMDCPANGEKTIRKENEWKP